MPCFVLLAALACSALEPGADVFGVDAGRSLAASPFESSVGDAGTDRPSPIAGCPPVRERPLRVLEGEPVLELGSDEGWSCTTNYLLASPLLIAPGQTLTIGPDTRIAGAQGSYLLARRGARLIANGTADAPVVFGSARRSGERAPADWRGLMFAGSAPSHVANATLPGSVSDARAFFGGGPSGDVAHDCGALRFVRVEFAGGSTDEEATPAAAVTLGACGSATEIDHLQIHRATDGLGLLGGTVGVRHVIVTNNAGGNAIEWTAGYTGPMQYVVAQGAGGAAALKGSNSEASPEQLPVSHPVIYNASIVGLRPLIASSSHYGVLLQHGATATLQNSIVVFFDDAALALESEATLAAVDVAQIGHLTVFGNGRDGQTHLTQAAERLGAALRVRDPGLDAALSLTEPDFVPRDPGVQSDIELTPAGLDPAATYRGALPFSGPDWTLGWTDYPLN
jgi:hypothetical protein